MLPFLNVGGDPATEYLADGITEGIINSLSQLPKLRVVPRSTAFRYRGRDIDLETVGLALNVKSIVTGRVVHHAENLNVQAELVDVVNESQIWGDQYRYPISEIFTLQEQIAWQISEALRVRLSREDKKRIGKRATGNTDAYQEYLRGRHQWSKWSLEGFQKAIGHFERAIEMDPSYALAFSGLADAYGAMGNYGFLPPGVAMPRSEAAAIKALELDGSLAEAHTAMALGQMIHHWDFGKAEEEFRRAIELNSQNAQTYTFHALLLCTVGRLEEALTQARLGARIDPLSPLGQMGIAWVLYFSRLHKESLEQVRATLVSNPGWVEAYTIAALNHERLGEFVKAAETWQNADNACGFPTEGTAALHQAAVDGGERGYFETRLRLLRDSPPTRYVSPFYCALLYAQLGRIDEAFEWLDRAIDERAGQVVFLLIEPFCDPLKSDPRYEQALQRVGLPRVTRESVLSNP